MPTRRRNPEPKPPSISLDEGKRRLKVMRDKATAMLEKRPLQQGDLDTWSNSTYEYIEQTFGQNSRHLDTFVGEAMFRVDTGWNAYVEREEAEKLSNRLRVVENLIEHIDLELSFSPLKPVAQTEDFWSRLHPTVVRAARSRFETGHYADAVEAAFKELNSKIKEHVRKATGQEFDGADLMNRAFSLGSPIIRLADLSTEDGKNIQKGYMQIFAGAMTGIRNPKAHSNVTIDEKRAIHHLHLASLLHDMFDERL